MEIVFIGLALSVCCFGIWRYGSVMRCGEIERDNDRTPTSFHEELDHVIPPI